MGHNLLEFVVTWLDGTPMFTRPKYQLSLDKEVMDGEEMREVVTDEECDFREGY